MYRLFYYAYGTYYYSHWVSAYHTRTVNLYFPSLNELIEWEQKNGYFNRGE